MAKQSNGGFLIGQIKQRQARIFERILNENGIQEFNGAQGRILYVLWHADNIPISELSKQTGLAKTTLTSLIEWNRLIYFTASALFYSVRLSTLSKKKIFIAQTPEERHKMMQKYAPICTTYMSYYTFDGKYIGEWHHLAKKFEK